MNATNPYQGTGLETYGLAAPRKAHWNLSSTALIEAAIRLGEGHFSEDGALIAITAPHTGRSPNDKFIVDESSCRGRVWWGKVNRPLPPEKFDGLVKKVGRYLSDREVYVQDLYAGTDADFRLPVRIITQHAWHNLFARNMFVRVKDAGEREGFQPQFTVLHAPDFEADPGEDGTNSGTFILVHFARKIILIGGTQYAGEIKKSIFSILNYLLPLKGVMSMHCSANVGNDGASAIFFGLSGTGKTTLSADPTRGLIGDDEHGWSDNGVFNYEGGCYAKVIKLSKEAEPEIWDAVHRFGAILENVDYDRTSGKLDLDSQKLTENTRGSYPIESIPNAVLEGKAGHPRTLIMLTYDAFGVLPPIARLTPEQAMYHFVSGYTAKVAGTEKGVTEPQATFSACFGAAFMALHPKEYAKLLKAKINKHGATTWLVNTGLAGGPYGVGKRMSIKNTRALVNAALEGRLDGVSFQKDPVFGFMVPTKAPDVPADVLIPRNTWADKAAYDKAAQDLARRFHDNFKQFEREVDADLLEGAPLTGR